MSPTGTSHHASPSLGAPAKKKRSVTEETSAADKSIGFDFQYYYFLDRLLNLKTGENVGLEAKDDVHTDLENDRQILVQVKHTVQTNAKSKPINLTELDYDLWKTLSNWAKIITDEADGRRKVTEQTKFIKRTEFVLLSNKSSSEGNRLLNKIADLERSPSSIDAVREIIKTLRLETEDKAIQGYIDQVLSLDEDVLNRFVSAIRFELNEDDMFAKIRRSIEEKWVDQDRVDEVFNRLDSNIRKDNFIAIKSGRPIVISYNDFRKKYRKIFEDTRRKLLPRLRFKPVIPNKIDEQLFIKQLLHIGDINADDTDLMLQFTTDKVTLVTHLQRWLKSGNLIQDDVENLHDDVIYEWRNAFRATYRKTVATSDDEIKDLAQSLLDDLRRIRFNISEQQLASNMSNGELYHLSDELSIGWHKQWKSLFKK